MTASRSLGPFVVRLEGSDVSPGLGKYSRHPVDERRRTHQSASRRRRQPQCGTGYDPQRRRVPLRDDTREPAMKNETATPPGRRACEAHTRQLRAIHDAVEQACAGQPTDFPSARSRELAAHTRIEPRALRVLREKRRNEGETQ